jgi:hypothetical protein
MLRHEIICRNDRCCGGVLTEKGVKTCNKSVKTCIIIGSNVVLLQPY